MDKKRTTFRELKFDLIIRDQTGKRIYKDSGNRTKVLDQFLLKFEGFGNKIDGLGHKVDLRRKHIKDLFKQK
jgi:hypothetical protein